VSATAKRQKGQDGRPWSSQDGSSDGTAGPQLEDLPLPKALGPPPGSEKYKGAAAAGGDASARAVLHDYCKKVLKLAAFRMVAVRCVMRVE
jgi:hypothetical protein